MLRICYYNINNCRIIPILKIKGLFPDGGNLLDVAVDKNVLSLYPKFRVSCLK